MAIVDLATTPQQRVKEKLDRARSLRAALGEGEPVEIGGEPWTLYPLRLGEILELHIWREKHPFPIPGGGLTIDDLDRLTWQKPGEDDPGSLSAADVPELLAFAEKTRRWDAEHALFVTWLSLRRNCLTEQEYEQCAARSEWPLSLQEVYHLVTIEQAQGLAERIFRLIGTPVGARPISAAASGGSGLGGSILSGDDPAGALPPAVPGNNAPAAPNPPGEMGQGAGGETPGS